MTIDEAIAHALEVAGEQQERADSAELIDILCGLDVEACKECAADHRQLAEWLTDYKELKNSIGAVKLKDMKEAVGLLHELNTENDQLTSQLLEAKRLLKLAVEDINLMTPFKSCSFCSFNNTNLCDPNVPCALQATWKYNDEVNEFLENGD